MWTIEYTKRFLKDLAELPTDIRTRIETIVFEELETENPFDLGYLEKMKGYSTHGDRNLQHRYSPGSSAKEAVLSSAPRSTTVKASNKSASASDKYETVMHTCCSPISMLHSAHPLPVKVY